jgi:hypothetical protein
VANRQDYLDRLQVAVQTVPVHEVFKGQTVCQGDVEVFDLHGHPKPNALMPGRTSTAGTMKANGLLPCSKSLPSIQQTSGSGSDRKGRKGKENL